MSVTKEHLLSVGMPSELADQAEAAGIPWLTILLYVAKYGPVIFALIQKDLAAGKTWLQILADLATLGGFSPAPVPHV